MIGDHRFAAWQFCNNGHPGDLLLRPTPLRLCCPRPRLFRPALTTSRLSFLRDPFWTLLFAPVRGAHLGASLRARDATSHATQASGPDVVAIVAITAHRDERFLHLKDEVFATGADHLCRPGEGGHGEMDRQSRPFAGRAGVLRPSFSRPSRHAEIDLPVREIYSIEVRYRWSGITGSGKHLQFQIQPGWARAPVRRSAMGGALHLKYLPLSSLWSGRAWLSTMRQM